MKLPHGKAFSNTSRVAAVLFDPTKEFIEDKLGQRYPIKLFADGAVRALDAGEYRYVTQNPNKAGSKYAHLARQGHQIMWVIHRPTNEFIIQYFDGKVKYNT